MNSTRCEVIIVAGGQGRRMGHQKPKAFISLEQKPLLIHTLETFAQMEIITGIILVVPSGWEETCATFCHSSRGQHKVTTIVCGGVRRQDSVRLGLEKLHPQTSVVLIQDAARIFTSPALINRVIQGVKTHGAAIPAVAVTDTLKRVNQQQEVEATVERRQLVMVQTPQGFERHLLEQAYQQAWQNQANATDDASLVEALGHRVHVVEGDMLNFKLTTPQDLILARALAQVKNNQED